VRIELPPRPAIRALCLAAFAGVLVQLFLLDEPRLLQEIVNATWDKFCHAVAFGSFAALLWLAIGFRSSWGNWLGIVAVASLDEFHQIFVPGRSADVLDVVADAIGAAIVTFILHQLSSATPAPRPAFEAATQPGD
jgi:VanZ family protein